MNKKLIISALSATLLLLCLISLCACSQDITDIPESKGLYLSGIITENNAPLAGVTVFVNDKKETVSDANGVFSLSGLSRGDEIEFAAEGYEFSPAEYTVEKSVYDLNVYATKSEEPNPPNPDPDPDPDPDPNPDPDPEPEPEPEQLSAPDKGVPVYSGRGNVLSFAVDSRSETFVLTLATKTFKTEIVSSLSENTVTVGEYSFAVTVSPSENAAKTAVSVDVTALTEGRNITLSVKVSSSAEDFLSSVTTVSRATFINIPPRIDKPVYENGQLSWTVADMPNDVIYAVMVEGVTITTTDLTSVDVSEYSDRFTAGARVTVAAMTDGMNIAVSEILVI